MSFIDKAVIHLLKRGQFCAFQGMNDKVATITHADVNQHTITLASMGLPSNAVVLILAALRTLGGGEFKAFPYDGGHSIYIGSGAFVKTRGKPVAIANERLTYNLTLANDTFDLHCLGYWTQGFI